MYRIRIRGPPHGRLDEARASLIARSLLSFMLIRKGEEHMTIRPLSAILAELSTTIKTLADQHDPPIPFDQELAMGNRALQRGIESQVFRAIEVLVLSAHASGLTRGPALQQALAYVEAVQVLQMSGKQLPADL